MKRTSEHQDEIRNRIKLIIDEKELTQKQFSDISCIAQGDISKYLNGKNTLADSFIYTIILKFSINPRWLEFGELPMYLSPNMEQNNANSGNGTQINNINGDNNVNMTMPKEAWEMLQSQQKTIESQQDSVKMAQVNMMELIKAFNK
jgi:transcriptional regulator with XRE-family HTH domain